MIEGLTFEKEHAHMDVDLKYYTYVFGFKHYIADAICGNIFARMPAHKYKELALRLTFVESEVRRLVSSNVLIFKNLFRGKHVSYLRKC